MGSKRSWRRDRRARAARRFATSPKTTPKTTEEKKVLYQEKVLLETVHKLADPHFFREPEIALSESLVGMLYSKEIRTIGDLVQKTEAELFERPGIGVVRLKKIKEALAALGLALKM